MTGGQVTLLVGDVRQRLADIPDGAIDCIVTSPPYWGLRDYGVPGQLGMEPSAAGHIEAMLSVFADLRRVLKPEGTCWINYGDCYATSVNGRAAAEVVGDDRVFRDKPFGTVGRGALGPGCLDRPFREVIEATKPKDLCMIPALLAVALRAEGWWLRSQNIWGKPNGMPDSSSGRDRPGTAHELIYLLTKSARYFYDPAAVRLAAAESSIARWQQDIDGQAGSTRANGGRKTNGPMKAVGGPRDDKQRGHGRRHAGFNARWDAMPRDEQMAGGRNLRNYEAWNAERWGGAVWHIAARAYREAHFATFPPALVERCIAAGCPQGGTVLDPFMGSGTTGLVASAMGRDCIGIDLNPAYAALAAERVGIFARVVEGAWTMEGAA